MLVCLCLYLVLDNLSVKGHEESNDQMSVCVYIYAVSHRSKESQCHHSIDATERSHHILQIGQPNQSHFTETETKLFSGSKLSVLRNMYDS